MGSAGTGTTLITPPSSIHSKRSPPLMPYRLRMAAGIAVCARFVTLVVVFITLILLLFYKALARLYKP